VKFLEKVHGWLMMCEMFPLRVSWILSLSIVIFNPKLPNLHHLQKINLLDFYRDFVHDIVMDTFPGDTVERISNSELVAQYRYLFFIDEDEVSFQSFLKGLELNMCDIGAEAVVGMNNLAAGSRSIHSIGNYSFNLYPPVLACVKELRSYLCIKERIMTAFGVDVANMDRLVKSPYETKLSVAVDSGLEVTNKDTDTPGLLIGQDKERVAELLRGSYDAYQKQVANEPSLINSRAARAHAESFYRSVIMNVDQYADPQASLLTMQCYARALAQLCVYNSESSPNVFAIYGEDDRDTQTFMRRLAIQIRIHGLMAIVDSHDCSGVASGTSNPDTGTGCVVRSEICALLNCDDADVLEQKVDQFYKWLNAHGPEEALALDGAPDTLLERLKQHTAPRVFPADSGGGGGKIGDSAVSVAVVEGTETETDRETVKIDQKVVGRHRSDVFFDHVSCWESKRKTRPSQIDNLLDFHRDFWKVSDSGFDGCFDYDTVFLDSWLLNSGDILWSTIIDILYRAVADHYGPKYANAEKNAMKWAQTVMFGTGIVLAIIAVIFATEANVSYSVFTTSVDTLISYITAAASGATVIYSQYTSYIQQSPTDQTFNSISKSYKDKLGYMRAVMQNLEIISSFLENPVAPLTFVDFLLPPTMASAMKSCQRHMLGERANTHRPCKLIIIVNGLQQCSPERIEETMEALTMLSNLTSFKIIVGVNPTVLQRSSSFQATYEKLAYWVEVPFALPAPSTGEKYKAALLPPSDKRSGARVDSRSYVT